MEKQIKDERTNKSPLECCQKRTCHKQCPVEWDNPFCHDTYCRVCHQVLLSQKKSLDIACGKCGWWSCKSCMENLDYSSMDTLPDYIKARITKDQYCIKCQDEKV